MQLEDSEEKAVVSAVRDSIGLSVVEPNDIAFQVRLFGVVSAGSPPPYWGAASRFLFLAIGGSSVEVDDVKRRKRRRSYTRLAAWKAGLRISGLVIARPGIDIEVDEVGVLRLQTPTAGVCPLITVALTLVNDQGMGEVEASCQKSELFHLGMKARR